MASLAAADLARDGPGFLARAPPGAIRVSSQRSPGIIVSNGGSQSTPEEFGHGAIEGVAGPEAANNAATSGHMVPLLALGLGFGPSVAMLLASLTMQGVQPGPLLMSQRPEVFWGVVASMYVGNVVLLVLNLPLVGMWTSLLRMPQSILLAFITLFMLIGAYSINNSALDLAVLVIMGVVGYVFRKIRLELAPLVLALVLGTISGALVRAEPDNQPRRPDCLHHTTDQRRAHGPARSHGCVGL